MAPKFLALVLSLGLALTFRAWPAPGAAAAAELTVFSAKDNPKADGLAFSVAFPADYELAEEPSQLFVAYTNKPEFPTVMTMSIAPLPKTVPPYDFKSFTEDNLDTFLADAYGSPNAKPRILSKSVGPHKGRSSIRAKALVNQPLLGRSQPSVEELLFVIYSDHILTMVCSTFNSQMNPNILLHFSERGGFADCDAFFDSLDLP
jgi:hypothetical protein